MSLREFSGVTVGVGHKNDKINEEATVVIALIVSGFGMDLSPRFARIIARQLEDAADVVDSINNNTGIVK